jgi:hypothetical protein
MERIVKSVTLIATIIGTLAFAAGAAHAQGYHYVNPYFRSDGSYVQPHYQTNPNGNPNDNWSSRPNTNPFTGQPGTRNPYSNPWSR